MAASLGEAYIDVKASTKGFAKSLSAELKRVLADAQRSADAAFANIGKSAKTASTAVVKSTQSQVRSQTSAITAFGKAYQAALKRQVADAKAAEKAIADAATARLAAFGRANARAVAAAKAADKERVASAAAAAKVIETLARAEAAAYTEAGKRNAAVAKQVEKAIADAAGAAATATRIADEERVRSAERTARAQIAAARLASREQAAAARAAARATSEAAAAQRAEIGALRAISKNAGNAVSAAFGAIATAVKFATLGVVALGLAMSAIGIQQAGNIQLAQTAFSSLASEIENGETKFEEYTDAQREAVGKDFVASLQDIALNSSIAFNTLTSTSQALIALGFSGDEAKAVILTVGDALAASGKAGGQLNEDLRGVVTAFAQIKGAGRLLAQDLNQITTRISPATRSKVQNQLARDLGLVSKAAKAASPEMAKARKEIIKLSEAGKIGDAAAIKALVEVLRDVPGAEGALPRVNATLPGQIEEFKETLRLRLGQAFTEITPELADKLSGLTKALGDKIVEIGPKLQEFAAGFADALAQALPAIIDVVGRAFEFLRQAIAAITPLLPGIITAFGALFSVASAVLSAIQGITSVFMSLPSGVQTALLAVGAIVGVLGSFVLVGIKVAIAIKKIQLAMIGLNLAFLTNPVFLVVAGLAALAAAFIIAWQRSETFREIVVKVLHTIAEVATAQIRLTLFVLEKLVDAFASVASHIPFVGDKIGGAFDRASDAIRGTRGAIDGLVDSINNIPTQKTVNINIKTTTDRDGSTRPEGFIGPIIPNNPESIARLQAQKAADKQAKDTEALLNRLARDSAKQQSELAGDTEKKGPSAAENAAKNRAARFREAIRGILDSLDAEFKKTLVDGTAKQIDTALDSLRKKIRSAFIAAKKEPPSGLLKRIDEDNKALKKLATEREKVLDKLAKATARAKEVANSIISFGNVISEEAAKIKTVVVDLSRLRIILPGEDAATGDGLTIQQRNAKSFAQTLKDRLAAIKSFQANIEKLIKSGLNKDTIDQIISAGVEEGGGVAASLTAASKETIKSINDSQAAIKKSAEELGNTAADSLFRSGKNVADGLIAGLEDRRDEIKAAMKQIADDLVSEIKKQLKEKSPSRVMRDRGNFAGKGLVLGLLDQAPAVKRAGLALANASIPTLQSQANAQSSAALSGITGGSARATASVTHNREINAPINQHFNVAPGVDPRALADQIGVGIARRLR